jgi:hypothetical protein
VNAAFDPRTWWWLSRASGIVALAMAVASVSFGLALSGRLIRRRHAPAWLLELHRHLGWLTLVFTVLHVAALVADSYVHFTLADLLVPMHSAWKPGAVAWGIVVLYVLLAVQVSSWFQRRLPRRVWHAIHLWSLFIVAGGAMHLALAGTDRLNRLLQLGGLAAFGAVIFAGTFRVLSKVAVDTAEPRPAPTRAPAPASAATADAESTDERLARLAARRAAQRQPAIAE